MTELDRRHFLKLVGIASTGVAAIGVPALLSACSSEPEKKRTGSKEFAALRVSSDIYLDEKPQRLAFSIFDDSQKIASKGSLNVTVISPSGEKETFQNTEVRDKGIRGKGIYSINPKLNEVGNWTLTTKFEGKALELSFHVNIASSAPALGSKCPAGNTPTDASPLDASILCTRFDGACGLHGQSVDDLLKTKKPFVVLFATPARCQTAYCGPVLDLTREVAKSINVPVIHIEIYKNEITTETLDAVSTWGLESEPWMFGVKADGTIDSRLDGAFDKSEIEDLFNRLT